jgi:hypothetical protein
MLIVCPARRQNESQIHRLRRFQGAGAQSEQSTPGASFGSPKDSISRINSLSEGVMSLNFQIVDGRNRDFLYYSEDSEKPWSSCST